MKLNLAARGRLALVLAATTSALITLTSGSARAEQFVLFDAMFTYTWDNAVSSRPSQSHYYVNDGNTLNKARPTNWLAPINYRTGKVHIRAEVFEKPPGDQQVGWAICYIANSGGYGCAYTTYYKTAGVFERDIDMTSWWNNGTINWDRGIKQIDVIYTINDSGRGHVHMYPNLKDLTTPTRLRLTVTHVSQGDSYRPAPGSGSDGGMADARGGDAAGGAGGSGGGGSGGSGATGGSTGTGGATGGGGSGGSSGSGGSGATGTGGSGSTGSGGSGTGGASASGGSSGGGSAGSGPAGRGGTTGGSAGGSGQNVSGSGCALASGDQRSSGFTLGLLAAIALLVRRRYSTPTGRS